MTLATTPLPAETEIERLQRQLSALVALKPYIIRAAETGELRFMQVRTLNNTIADVLQQLE